MARRFEVLRPHLSEFQRRLWLGAEAAELGAGGVAVVALAAGVAPDTVRRGRAEAQGLDAASVVRSRRPDAVAVAGLLGSALTSPPCPEQADQIEDVAKHLYLVRARVDHVAQLAG